MDIKEEVNKVRGLEQAYLKLRNIQCNSDKTIKAFHAWHKAMLLLFNKTVPANNADFQIIKNKDVSGNGFILKDVFDEISGRYAILMDNIENGRIKAPEQNEIVKPSADKSPLVFISHASADKKIIKDFVDKILKEGLGLRDENIAFTSFEATGVTPGDDITQFIKDNIEAAQIVLSMVSNAYKASAICQNEVGAAWALGKKPIQVLLSDVDFDDLGWLLNVRKAGKIDDQEYLDHLEEVLCEKLGIGLVSPRHWNPCVKSFLASLQQSPSEIVPTEVTANGIKKAVIRAYSVKEKSGSRTVYIKNEGDASAINLQVDIPNGNEYWACRPSLPVSYEELLPGAQRKLILALIEGQDVATLCYSWDDETQKGNKQQQTIDL